MTGVDMPPVLLSPNTIHHRQITWVNGLIYRESSYVVKFFVERDVIRVRVDTTIVLLYSHLWRRYSLLRLS
jgi:hypothetical protein